MLKRVLVLLALALVIAACNGPAISGLTVTDRSPVANATGVTPSTQVTATFSLGIDADTITSAGAFTLAAGDDPVPGTVTYDAGNRTATFTPATTLAYSTQYTVTIASTVATTDGVALGSPVSWSFTTVAPSSDELAFANPGVTTYPTPTTPRVSSIGEEGEFSIEFPAFVNAVGEPSEYAFELFQDDDSPDLERQITTYAYDDPLGSGDTVPAVTYGLTFDADTGTISGRSPIPGTYTGFVRLTDADGQTLDATYEIVLNYTAEYLEGDTDILVPAGSATADPEDRFTLVAGALVTIAGANPGAFGVRRPGEPTLIPGTERVFQLIRIDDPDADGAGANGTIEINDFAGTISVLQTRVEPTATAQTWTYRVDVTHATGTVQTETFTFTLAAATD